ncbi:MAG: ABC transporter substrate-binding protein [Pseudomonadota bacterium]
MKKFSLILLVFLCAFSLFAKGMQERKITVLYTGDGPPGVNLFQKAADATIAKFPGLSVEFQKVDLSTGAPVTMDTLLAGGMAPDIYYDSMVRASRYILPDFALPLNEYMDLKNYLYLEPLTRDGKVLALPGTGGAQGMCLNLDLLDAAGYTVPDNWDLEDFQEMCAKIKAYADKTGKEAYGTGLFAGNQSGDYLWMQWFAVFGVDLYSENYTESTENQGGSSVWKFFKDLKDKEYVPAKSAILTDDDYALMWSKGMFAATAFYPSWCSAYFDSAISQGLIKTPHRYKFVSFPNKAPACTNYSGIVVNKNSKVKEAVVYLLEQVTSAESGTLHVQIDSSIAFRKDISAQPNDKHAREVNAIVAENGLYDLGVTNAWFAEVRAQGFPVLQEVLTGKMDAQKAAKEYARRVNEIIK